MLIESGFRWLLAVVIALLLIGLIAYGGGPTHRRGDEVGALARAATVGFIHVG